MNDVNEIRDYLTPFKYGRPVIAPSGEAGRFDRYGVDNMRICRHNGMFYMFYIGFDGIGYRTALAVSENLLDWVPKGIVLDRGSGHPWDTNGRAISSLLCDVDLYGNRTLIKHEGKYWMFYHAYPGTGYETGAAANGLAWSTDNALLDWHCEESPVFVKGKDGAWDGGGLYSTWIVPRDDGFLLYYNGKERGDFPWHEQVGVAFSEHLHDWKRYEKNPILRITKDHWDSLFSCGQHVLFDSQKQRWVMFYCGFDGRHAQDGVAIGTNMLDFRKYEKPILPYGVPGSLDATHAHKPCVIWHDNMLWHFYCAVRPTVSDTERARFGNEYRCITVARSKPF